MTLTKSFLVKAASVAIFSVALIALFPVRAEACSCVCRGSIKSLIKWDLGLSEAVFIGRVVEITLERGDVTPAPGHSFPTVNYKARFAVEEPFKGVTDKFIWTDTGDGNCSPGKLTVGERYLIYASRSERGTNLWVGGCCNRSRQMVHPTYSKADRKKLVREIDLLRRLRTKKSEIALSETKVPN